MNSMASFRENKYANILMLGCIFALMMASVSMLEFFLPINGADRGEFFKRIIVGLGFNLTLSFFVPFALFIFPEYIRKILFITLAFICIIFFTASVLHLNVYNQLLAAPSLMVLLDTDVTEANEFVNLYASGWIFLLFLLALLTTIVLAVYAWELSNRIFALGFSKIYACLALALVMVLSYFGWNKIYFSLDNPIPFIVQTGGDVLVQKSQYQKLLTSKPKNSGAYLANSAQGPSTHIIIIGESATRSHLSLYGYERETNPYLKTPPQNMQMLIAPDVCSSAHATYGSIANIMLGSSKELSFDKDGAAPPTLVSIVKDAGFKTHWISNQPGAGYGSMVSFWSVAVDNSVFLNKRDYRVGYDFDEVLLPSLKAALQDSSKNQVIVLHMMGSHPGYKQRYPKKFGHWAADDLVPRSVKRRNEADFDKAIYNSYDNSILYSDYVIAEVLKLAKLNDVASVVYFSDHGQNLGEKNTHVGHSTENGPKQGFEVPLIFWLNSSKLLDSDIKADKIKLNLAKPYSLERIQYTLFDLYGIALPTPQPDKSLLSEKYEAINRHCDSIKE